MPSPVTLCRRSYYGRPTYGIRPEDIRPPDTCDNLIASCSVRNEEHGSHDWLDEDAPRIEPRYCWRHCEGVSGLERRAAGASTPPATAPLPSSSCREAQVSSNAQGRARKPGPAATAQRDRG